MYLEHCPRDESLPCTRFHFKKYWDNDRSYYHEASTEFRWHLVRDLLLREVCAHRAKIISSSNGHLTIGFVLDAKFWTAIRPYGHEPAS